MIEKYALMAKKEKIHLSLDLEEDVIISADGDRLAQVFSNLIDNSLKFTPPGGDVKISTQVEHPIVKILVSDTGKGISKQDQTRIFERFYQVDKSRKGGEGRGVGLGLSIAKQIVMAHAGDISVESDLGKGTIFMVKMPFRQKA